MELDFFGVVIQNTSVVSKSNRLHVVIFRFFLPYQFEVCFIYIHTKMMGNFPKVLNSNWFICN